MCYRTDTSIVLHRPSSASCRSLYSRVAGPSSGRKDRVHLEHCKRHLLAMCCRFRKKTVLRLLVNELTAVRRRSRVASQSFECFLTTQVKNKARVLNTQGFQAFTTTRSSKRHVSCTTYTNAEGYIDERRLPRTSPGAADYVSSLNGTLYAKAIKEGAQHHFIGLLSSRQGGQSRGLTQALDDSVEPLVLLQPGHLINSFRVCSKYQSSQAFDLTQRGQSKPTSTAAEG